MERDGAPQEGIGCAPLVWASLTLIAIAAVLWTAGIVLEDAARCQDVCQWAAFLLVFAGGPVSALVTVAGGSDLVLAWPVDILAWIMIGVLHTRISGEAAPFRWAWIRTTLLIVAAALIYGGLLSLAIEQA